MISTADGIVVPAPIERAVDDTWADGVDDTRVGDRGVDEPHEVDVPSHDDPEDRDGPSPVASRPAVPPSTAVPAVPEPPAHQEDTTPPARAARSRWFRRDVPDATEASPLAGSAEGPPADALPVATGAEEGPADDRVAVHGGGTAYAALVNEPVPDAPTFDNLESDSELTDTPVIDARYADAAWAGSAVDEATPARSPLADSDPVDAPVTDAVTDAVTEAVAGAAPVVEAPESPFPAYPPSEAFIPEGGPLSQGGPQASSGEKASGEKRPSRAQRISRAERRATVAAIVRAVAPPRAAEATDEEGALSRPAPDHDVDHDVDGPAAASGSTVEAPVAEPTHTPAAEPTDTPGTDPSEASAPRTGEVHEAASGPADTRSLLAVHEDHTPGDAAPPAGARTGRAKRFTVIGIVVMLLALVLAALVRPSTSAQASKVAPLHHATAVAASSLTTTAQPPPNPNPSAPGVTVNSPADQSDPVLFRDGGQYLLYTSGVPQTGPNVTVMNVPVSSSTDFVNWSPLTEVLPTLPHWAEPGFTWAPEVHKFGSNYVLYFTADVRGTGMQCIGLATAASAVGPFAPNASPFICQRNLGGTIDPRVFVATDGTPWMLFKSDQNIGGRATPTTLWSQRLSPDGLHLVGPRNDLMGPDERWQGTIVEAPDMVEVNGVFWVFYSANWFNQPAYGIGAARCKGPAGPCADTKNTPLLASNTQGVGPGEASVFTDGAGAWMLYSPVRAVGGAPPRPVDITSIGFGPKGPYLAAGGPPPSLAVAGASAP